MKNLNPIIMTNMYRKSRTPIFIVTIYLLAFSLICPRGIQGGEIYTYTDKNGVTVITNTPIPEKYQKKAQKIDAYKELKPSNNRSKTNAEIDALIYRLENDPNNRVTQSMGGGVVKTGGLKKHVLKEIIKLRKAQHRSQGNQADDMEDKVSDMEDKTDEMEAKIRSQESEIQDLERDKRMSEHNQRTQWLNQQMGH